MGQYVLSSKRPVLQLLSLQETATPQGLPVGIPTIAGKCRLSGDGVWVLPLGHPKIGTNQTSGSVFEKALPRREQRASREPPELCTKFWMAEAIWGDILSVF